jgi:hypothetical protein
MPVTSETIPGRRGLLWRQQSARTQEIARRAAMPGGSGSFDTSGASQIPRDGSDCIDRATGQQPLTRTQRHCIALQLQIGIGQHEPVHDIQREQVPGECLEHPGQPGNDQATLELEVRQPL